MNIDTLIVIVSGIATVACYVGYRYLSENVKLTFKDQRIPQNKKGV